MMEAAEITLRFVWSLISGLLSPYNLFNPVAWWLIFLGAKSHKERLFSASIVLFATYLIIYAFFLYPNFNFDFRADPMAYGSLYAYVWAIVLIHPIFYGLIAFVVSHLLDADDDARSTQ